MEGWEEGWLNILHCWERKEVFPKLKEICELNKVAREFLMSQKGTCPGVPLGIPTSIFVVYSCTH